MRQQDIEKKLNELRSLHSETEVVEFKEAKENYDFRSLGKYFSALSNEANLKGLDSAWLIFGVKDKDHSIVGSNFRSHRSMLDHLKREIADKTNNRVTFIEIYELFID
jgi:ATP-dependent DNA helicase RecG